GIEHPPVGGRDLQHLGLVVEGLGALVGQRRPLLGGGRARARPGQPVGLARIRLRVGGGRGLVVRAGCRRRRRVGAGRGQRRGVVVEGAVRRARGGRGLLLPVAGSAVVVTR